MKLVEIFLPLQRGDGEKVAQSDVRAVLDALANRFGGATAHTRAPAEGLWKQGEVERDQVVLVEVVVDTLDLDWWQHYRRQLEQSFDQEQVLIRVSECELI